MPKNWLITLVVLCLVGFLTNGTLVAYAVQAQALSRQAERDNDTKERVLNTERIQELNKKVGEIEEKKLEERVTRLEAIAETNHTLLVGIAASIAVLLLETAMRLLTALAGRRKI